MYNEIVLIILVQLIKRGGDEVFSINLQSRQPISEQLYTRINQLISLGALKPGEKLPTVRALATSIGINPNTAAKAYQMLERDGIIYTVVGKGSFVRDDVDINRQKKDMILIELKQVVEKAYSAGITPEEIAQVIGTNYIDHMGGIEDA